MKDLTQDNKLHLLNKVCTQILYWLYYNGLDCLFLYGGSISVFISENIKIYLLGTHCKGT